jgi:hypothetical protein
MSQQYEQDHLGATPWDDAAAKTPRSEIRYVTLTIADGEVQLINSDGESLAQGSIAGLRPRKLIAGLKNTVAGVVLDLGDHCWMINFGTLRSRFQPAGLPTKVIKAFDPTAAFRDLKRCQDVRDEFLKTVEQLGGRVIEPSP